MILDSLGLSPRIEVEKQKRRENDMVIELNFTIRFGLKNKKITIRIEW